MNDNKQYNSNFFFKISLALMIIVYAGFISKAIFNNESITQISPVIMAHGILNGAWYLLLVIQSALISQGNRILHIKLGQLSVVLAVALVVVGFMMLNELVDSILLKVDFNPNNQQHLANLAGLIWGTAMQWVVFVYLYCHAIVKRAVPVTHKRLMFFSALVMSLGGIARIFEVLSLPGEFTLIVLLAFIITLFVFDKRAVGKIQTATWIGSALTLAMVFSFFIVGGSHWWIQLVAAWLI